MYVRVYALEYSYPCSQKTSITITCFVVTTDLVDVGLGDWGSGRGGGRDGGESGCRSGSRIGLLGKDLESAFHVQRLFCQIQA